MADAPELYGVNWKNGLRLVNNNAGIYLKLLKIFAANPMHGEFAEAVTGGDMKTAAEKAHALKGVSANLGLTLLFEAIKELEARVKASTVAPDDPQMKELEEIFNRTMESVHAVLADPELMKG